jgi:hypothetical protein
MQTSLDKYSREIKLMNTVHTDGYDFKLNYLDYTSHPTSVSPDVHDHTPDGEHFFLPYTGNGYIGLSLQSTQGIYVNFQKSLSLLLHYNPLVQVYSDTLSRAEASVTEIRNGLVHLHQCFQDGIECFSIQNTLYAHRTRPSLLVEEVLFSNPSKDSVSFNILQMGEKQWNHTKSQIVAIDGTEFSLTSGVIDVNIDHKVKHLCVCVGSSRLPTEMLLNGHEFFKKYTVLTAVKHSSALLTGKLENLEPVLGELETQVLEEIKEALRVGYKRVKNKHF